jgi:subtilisin family serine protease
MKVPAYEGMTLEEFVKQPYIIQFYAKTYPFFESKIRGIPFIRIGKRVRSGFAVFHLDSRRIHDLIDLIGTSYIEMYPYPMTLLGRSSLEASTVIQVQRHPALDLRGRGTLIGIIDTGIDFTKETFMFEDGTSKIRYLWDQTIEGNAPGDFLIGSEYTNEQLNRALRSNTPHSYIPSVDTVGHGTFLASVAAGREDSEYVGAAPDAELLVVKLRRMQENLSDIFLVPRSQENVFSSADIMLAIDYMLDKSYELEMPLVICLGVGTTLAGSDGFEVLEQYIDSVSKFSGVCICTAAGNESNTGHHTSGSISAVNSTYTMQVQVPQNANSFIINAFVNPPDRMSVSLKSPLGEIVPRAIAMPTHRTETSLVLERTRIEIVYFFPLSPIGDQFIHIRFFNPTPGLWDVVFHGDIILYGRVNAWLPTTGLISPGIKFLTPNPNMTIVTPSTAMGGISVGAYDDRNDSLYVNSSWGPTRRNLQKPDLVAPGVGVTGVFPMGSGTMTGTSVATAITAGACALMMQWGIVERNDISLDTSRIKSFLIRGCRRDANIEYPSPQWGYGKLDLFNTFRNLRGVL